MAPLIGRTESECASGAYSFPRRLDWTSGPRLSFYHAVGIIPQVVIDAPPRPIQSCPQLVACIPRRTPVSITHGLDRHHLLMSVRTVVSGDTEAGGVVGERGVPTPTAGLSRNAVSCREKFHMENHRRIADQHDTPNPRESAGSQLLENGRERNHRRLNRRKRMTLLFTY